ncbi:MAG: hypothetical protein J5985_01240 [Kiritimatiellae bacterium]|nr:hypothetical protein [Kiritimatiellia bacterium]
MKRPTLVTEKPIFQKRIVARYLFLTVFAVSYVSMAQGGEELVVASLPQQGDVAVVQEDGV